MIGTGFKETEGAIPSQGAYSSLPPTRYGRTGYMLTKRVFDLVVSVFCLLLFAPVFAIVALAIAILDGTPVIYRHRRVGRHGKAIHILKFRSMVKNADEVLKANPELHAEFLKTFKLDHDPRITRTGALIRRLSIDEFPQLLNVISGEMSLVGPRPIVPQELERYEDRQDVYLAMVPGCAGLWQCSGRSDTTYLERVKLDLEYYENASFWGDVSILFRTVGSVLSRKGAH